MGPLTDDERAIARRLVACKGWRWLPGMAATPEHPEMAWCGTVRIHGIDGEHFCLGGHAMIRTIGRVPDLSDPLTRLGVLQVVRDAHGDQTAFLRYVPACIQWPAAWLWEAGQPGVRSTGHAPTEIEALAAALEAAP